MWLQFAQRHLGVNWDAVIQNVEITFLKIHNALPVGILDIRIPDVPLFGNRPVENGRSCRQLEDFQRNTPADRGQGLSKSIPGDAPADRIEFPCKLMKLGSEFRSILLLHFSSQSRVTRESPGRFDHVLKSLP